MARVVALVPDLLFGSRVQAMLISAGREVELIASEQALRERLGGAGAPDALIIDLTEELDGAALVQSLSAAGLLDGVRTLGFYSHVDAPARERAVQAGFDLVVPRSRMAREGPQLITRLAQQPRLASEPATRQKEPG